MGTRGVRTRGRIVWAREQERKVNAYEKQRRRIGTRRRGNMRNGVGSRHKSADGVIRRGGKGRSNRKWKTSSRAGEYKE